MTALTRVGALAMSVVLLFALVAGGAGTDARLGDTEVVEVPVLLVGEDPRLDGEALRLTYQGLADADQHWRDAVIAARDGETARAAAGNAPEYVVRFESTGGDTVTVLLAGGATHASTVGIDADTLATALGLSSFDPDVVDLRVGGVLTGYDTTADGLVTVDVADWDDRRLTFTVAPDDPSTTADESGTEVPTTDESPGDESTPEESTSDDSTPDETSTEESTPEEPTPEESTTEEPTTEEPTTDDSTTEESTPAETPTEEPTTEEPSTDDSTTEESTTDESSDDQPTTAASVAPVGQTSGVGA
jgi:hypothetical protein